MSSKTFSRYCNYIIGFISVCIWLLLGWNYFHGGIPSHHLFANEDLPSVSNAWGGLLLPLLAWYLIHRIQKRLSPSNNEDSIEIGKVKRTAFGFCISAIYASTIAFSFSLGYNSVSDYMFMALFAIAILFPVYRGEYYLGFVIGLTYFFGAVLPTLIGGVIVLLSLAASVTVGFARSKLKKSAT